ncbi:hypothetical protein ACNQ2K_01455 [Mycoplasma sp. VS292A]|uniref:hypothetical protein n=1 Tax=Mycoplasma sp. VS292A TaxID=3401680 RepID=UPI003AAB0667
MKKRNILILSSVSALGAILPVSVISASTNEINKNPDENVKALQTQLREILKKIDLLIYPIDMDAFNHAIDSIPNVAQEELDKISKVITNDIEIAKSVSWLKYSAIYSIPAEYLPNIYSKIDQFYATINQSLAQLSDQPTANLANEVKNFTDNDFTTKSRAFREYYNTHIDKLNSNTLGSLSYNFYQNVRSWMQVPPMTAQQFIDTYNTLINMNAQMQNYNLYVSSINYMLTNNFMFPGLGSGPQAAALKQANNNLANAFPNKSGPYNAQQIAQIWQNITNCTTNAITASKDFYTFAVDLQVKNGLFDQTVADNFISKNVTPATTLNDINNIYAPYNALITIYTGVQTINQVKPFLEALEKEKLISYCPDEYAELKQQYEQYKNLDPTAPNALQLATQYQNNISSTLQGLTATLLSAAFPQNPSIPNAMGTLYMNSTNKIMNFEIASGVTWAQQVREQIDIDTALIDKFNNLQTQLLITTVGPSSPAQLNPEQQAKNKEINLNYNLSTSNAQTEFLNARNTVENYITSINDGSTQNLLASDIEQALAQLNEALNTLNGFSILQDIQNSIDKLKPLVTSDAVDLLLKEKAQLQNHFQAQSLINKIAALSTNITQFHAFMNSGLYATMAQLSNYNYQTMFKLANYNAYDTYQNDLTQSTIYTTCKAFVDSIADQVSVLFDSSSKKIKITNPDLITKFINLVTYEYNAESLLIPTYWAGLNASVSALLQQASSINDQNTIDQINNLSLNITKYSAAKDLSTVPYFFALKAGFNSMLTTYYTSLFASDKYPNLSQELLNSYIVEAKSGTKTLANLLNQASSTSQDANKLVAVLQQATNALPANTTSANNLSNLNTDIYNKILNSNNQVLPNVLDVNINTYITALNNWMLQNQRISAIELLKPLISLTASQVTYFTNEINQDATPESIQYSLQQAKLLYQAMDNALGAANNYKTLDNLKAFATASKDVMQAIKNAYDQVDSLTQASYNGLSAIKINQAANNLNNLLDNYKALIPVVPKPSPKPTPVPEPKPTPVPVTPAPSPKKDNTTPTVDNNPTNNSSPSIWYWLPTVIVGALAGIFGTIGSVFKRKNKK